jgi:hypothetical protein
MTTEEKLDKLLQLVEGKKETPKPKDNWDKTQVVLSALTGVVALLIALVSLLITRSTTESANAQTKAFQDQQIAIQRSEDTRKLREETLEEMKSLPAIAGFRSSTDPAMRQMALILLEKIKKDPVWKDLPVGLYANAPSDTAPSKSDATRTARQPDTAGTFWVYLGEKQQNKWQPGFFNIDGIPAPGTDIASLGLSVYKRDSPPQNIGDPKDDKWYMDPPIGILRPRSRVRVIETIKLAGDNYWARVKGK